MKLRIPRRIKVEEESSESETEAAAAPNPDSKEAEEQVKDKVPEAVTSKTLTVSAIDMQ